MKLKQKRKTRKLRRLNKQFIILSSCLILLVTIFITINYFEQKSNKTTQSNNFYSSYITTKSETPTKNFLQINWGQLPLYKEYYEKTNHSLYTTYDETLIDSQIFKIYDKLTIVFPLTNKIRYTVTHKVNSYSVTLRVLESFSLETQFPNAIHLILSSLTNFTHTYPKLRCLLDIENIKHKKTIEIPSSDIKTLRDLYSSSSTIVKIIKLNYYNIKNKTLFNLLVVLNDFFWGYLNGLLGNREINGVNKDKDIIGTNLGVLSFSVGLTYIKFAQNIIIFSCYSAILDLFNVIKHMEIYYGLKDYIQRLNNSLVKSKKMNFIIGNLYKLIEIIKIKEKIHKKEIIVLFEVIGNQIESLKYELG